MSVDYRLGVGNPMGIPFPWESLGNGNSHTAHDGNGNGTGNKANGNGNSIYFTRIKNSQNYCDTLDQPLKLKSANRAYTYYIICFELKSVKIK